MPRDTFKPGTGPQNVHRPLVITVQAPSTTSSAAPILAGQPLKWARVSEVTGAGSTVGLGRQCALCAANDVPELYAEERVTEPYKPLAVAVLRPGAPAGAYPTGAFVLRLPITGSPATGTDLSLVADGTNASKVVANASGSVATGVVGSNNAIRWTAVSKGIGGNSITVAITNPGGTVTSEVVTVSGSAVSVAARTSSGSITSTAAQIMDAVRAHAGASALVSVANESTSTGAGTVAAVSATPLTGGSGGAGAVISIEGTAAEVLF